MKISFEYQDRDLRIKLNQLDARVNARIDALLSYYALRGMAMMKSEAPWTDRTGAARTGLHTTVSSSGSSRAITFAHSVSYGIWLEVKYSGRDAIIMPSVRKTGYELLAALRGVMRG